MDQLIHRLVTVAIIYIINMQLQRHMQRTRHHNIPQPIQIDVQLMQILNWIIIINMKNARNILPPPTPHLLMQQQQQQQPPHHHRHQQHGRNMDITCQNPNLIMAMIFR